MLLFVLVATLSPGGATALATASGARFGVRRSLPLMLGIAAGLATLAAAASLGLAGVLFRVPHVELAVRLLGTAYLLRLAWQTARGGAPGQATLERPRRFGAGVLLLWLNPKGWAMTLSAAGAFATAVDGPARLALLLGGTFLVGATVSQLAWCTLGGVLGRILTRPWHWRLLNGALAVLLVASVVPLWLEAP
ncbi:Threonine/homoserine/homoserine lactone efflux protein [Microlunatus flavus]|uniref:Threonine/homoserine/homoserine lactone efflux protein n=1 Tax=Microlunatus flavus TaxID=1036181 RepID=A0A1H9AQ62_9ACTN|nr:Threonine/homoserine/homoserine lactone efflux protein [Microlunatus flavus]